MPGGTVDDCEAIAFESPLLDASVFTSSLACDVDFSTGFDAFVGVGGMVKLANGTVTPGMGNRMRDGVKGAAVGAIRDIGLAIGSSRVAGSA